MTAIREAYLSQRFNEFLDRFSPPRAIANNPTAMQQDADDMLRTVLRYAPREEYGEWLGAVLRELQEGMTTRSWPAPGELAKACRMKGAAKSQPSALVEDHAIDRMIDWHGKFGTQMPGHGNPARTAELIQRGVLANEREARFKGFELGEDQRRRAMEQPSTRDEWRHHVRVIARLRGISESEAESSIREQPRAPADRSRAQIPDLSAPYDSNSFAA